MISMKQMMPILGDIASVILMLSPWLMFLRMILMQSVNEEFNGLPHAASLANCILWVIYQLVNPDNILVLIINIIGIVIQLVYIVIPLSYGSRRVRISILKMVAVEFTLMGILMACVFAGFHTLNRRVKIVGWACVASGVLMYGSTIPALIDAWRTMSTDNIPLPLILAGLANTTLWLTTGIMENNMYMLVQNGCGLFLVIVQVGVYILIWTCNRSPPTASERAPPAAQSHPTAARECAPLADNERAPPAADSPLTANSPPTATATATVTADQMIITSASTD